MKQKASQTCDAYMLELRLALPDCKYQNDADELLKDSSYLGSIIKRSKTTCLVK